MANDIDVLARNLGLSLDQARMTDREHNLLVDVLRRVLSFSGQGSQERQQYSGLVVQPGLVNSGTYLTHPRKVYECRELEDADYRALIGDGASAVINSRVHLLHWRHLGFLANGVDVAVWTAQRGLSNTGLMAQIMTKASERLIAGGSMRAAYELVDRVEKDLRP